VAVSPRRIGLLGGESTGKTTLAMALAEELPGFVAEEYLRDFVRDFGRIPTPADQEGIYLAQQMAVNRAMSAAGHAQVPWVIADPLPLMTAVYSVAYFDVDSLLAGGIADASTYDVLLWCAPDFPWRADLGQRDGPAYRLRVEDVIAHRVAPRLPLHQVSGTPPERLEQALLLCTEASADP
jgi:HTH-type transcriptional repressor of NAD biosynthesis genes